MSGSVNKAQEMIKIPIPSPDFQCQQDRAKRYEKKIWLTILNNEKKLLKLSDFATASLPQSPAAPG